MSSQLPNKWVETTLGNIALVQSGGTPSRSKKAYWNGNVPWVKISDIDQWYVSKTQEFITEEGLNNSSTKLFPKGTILFTIFATIGKVGVLSIEATTNQAIAGVTPVKLVDHRFVTYALLELAQELEKEGKGVAQKNINLTILKALDVPLPPLSEQKRIVAKLDGLFAHLEEVQTRLDKVPQLLKDFRQAVLTKAVSGELLGVVEMKQLGDFNIDIKTGPFGSALHKSDYISDGIPVINPSHIKAGNILPNHEVSINNKKAEELSRWFLDDNDVILGRRGEMGRAAKYESSFGAMICGTGSLVLKTTDTVSADFLTYYLRSPFCVSFLEQNSVGSTMINLNQKILKSLPFPNLSLSQQEKSIEKVEDLFTKASLIEDKYKALKFKSDNLPQAVLAKAFKGELVEQLPTDGDARDLLKEIEALKAEVKPKKRSKK